MKKLLATAMFSAMIILPVSAVEQQPVKYELGNYNFSFEKQEETQSVELKNTESAVEPEITPLTQSGESAESASTPKILPALPNEKPVVVDTKIKPVSESIDAQKQVVKQIKQEEQAKEELKSIQNQQIEEPHSEEAEKIQEETENTNTLQEQELQTNSPEEKYEIKTPLPQSSVTPSEEDLKIKTNLPPKTHAPMPTQKVLDETHSVTNGELPVKRVVQPTKAPAKEPQRSKIVEEENLDEITLTKDNQTTENSENPEASAVNKTETSTAEEQKDGAKKEEQKVKEKKKLPFTFELQKMQYNGVDSRQL